MLPIQPLPTPKKSPGIQHRVAKEIIKRAIHGKKIYNTYLNAFNGRSSIRDLIEEGMDGLMYFYQLEEEVRYLADSLHKILSILNIKLGDYESLSLKEMGEIADIIENLFNSIGLLKLTDTP